MQIELSGHHVEVTPGIRRHVEEKAEHLLRIFDGISTFHVILTVERNSVAAEFVANVSHAAPLVAKAVGETAHAAIDLAAERVETQLRRHKEKVREHRVRDHGAEPPASEEPDEEETDPWETSSRTD